MKSRIGFLVSGPKGLGLLSSVHRDCDVPFVSSHQVKGLQLDFYAEVKSFCASHGYRFVDRDAMSVDLMRSASLIFVAGWQHRLTTDLERVVVFHDSLLPAFRGFAPTVTALICGNEQLGVTAFRPIEEMDAGPIYAQSALAIDYPIKVRKAYEQLGACYADVARRVMASHAANRLDADAQPQDDRQVSYSVWRSPDDYVVDWSWPSSKIKRFVDAVGWPYEGARTVLPAGRIIIDDVEEAGERHFADRHPGKIWKIDGGIPEVICGSGMIRILSAREENGARVRFARIRERFVR